VPAAGRPPVAARASTRRRGRDRSALSPPPRLTAGQRCRIAAPREVVWRHLTEPDLVAEWFGDCDALSPDRSFRIDFGDGDFFVGRVAAWEAPGRLELVWKFMALGPEYQITFTLAEVDGETEVAVRDTGALTRAEADGLDEGWRDFLSRLHKRCVTGERARYQWTPSIGLAAVLGVPPAQQRRVARRCRALPAPRAPPPPATGAG